MYVLYHVITKHYNKSSDGQVVKVLDLKFNGVSLRAFKSCSPATFLKFSNSLNGLNEQ